MNKLVVSGKDYISAIYDNNIDRQEYETAINIIERFINGEPLTFILKEYSMSFQKFNYIITRHPDFSIVFEDMINMHKSALKDSLVTELIMQAKTGNTKALMFALERMYPEEFGRKLEISNSPVDDNPRILEKFVNAEYTK